MNDKKYLYVSKQNHKRTHSETNITSASEEIFSKFPAQSRLHEFNLSKRVDVMEKLKTFFDGQLELGFLYNGKVKPFSKNFKLNEELIVSLSKNNEEKKISIVCRPFESIASRYILLNNLSVDGVLKFAQDSRDPNNNINHDGTLIIEIAPKLFQVWLSLGLQFPIKKRKIIVDYFTNSQTMIEWSFAPCFLNMQYDWQEESSNYFYVHAGNSKNFISSVNMNARYKLSKKLNKHILDRMYEV